MTCVLPCPECGTILVKIRKRRSDRKDGSGDTQHHVWHCPVPDGGCGGIAKLVVSYPTRPS